MARSTMEFVKPLTLQRFVTYYHKDLDERKSVKKLTEGIWDFLHNEHGIDFDHTKRLRMEFQSLGSSFKFMYYIDKEGKERYVDPRNTEVMKFGEMANFMITNLVEKKQNLEVLVEFDERKDEDCITISRKFT